jgi:DNA-binding NarL/FixJ family response regulator
VINVLIADGEPVARRGIRMILEAEPDVGVVGEAGNGAEAVALARRRDVDVVLMDVRRGDGLEATRALAGPDVERGRRVEVVAVTSLDDEDHLFGALRAGAAGLLLKDVTPEVLVLAVRAVAAGKGLIDAQITRWIIARLVHLSPRPERVSALDQLSTRERSVLLEIARGRSNAEIAAALFVEESTVKTHVSAVLAKLSLRSRLQAVIVAYESGLVAPGTRDLRAADASVERRRRAAVAGRTLVR